MNYILTVEIPITSVPDNISIQEAKVIAEIWLNGRIPDAKTIDFREAKVEAPNFMVQSEAAQLQAIQEYRSKGAEVIKCRYCGTEFEHNGRPELQKCPNCGSKLLV